MSHDLKYDDLLEVLDNMAGLGGLMMAHNVDWNDLSDHGIDFPKIFLAYYVYDYEHSDDFEENEV